MQVSVDCACELYARLTGSQPVLLYGILLNKQAFFSSWKKHLTLRNFPQKASCKILQPIGTQNNRCGDTYSYTVRQLLAPHVNAGKALLHHPTSVSTGLLKPLCVSTNARIV
jgi:hypothetical protein